MRFQSVSVLAVMAVLVVSSKGLAAAPALECDGSGEDMICISLPEEAPESSVAAQAPAQEKMPATLASKEDLSGGAADFVVLPDADIAGTTGEVDVAELRVDEATSAGMEVLAQIQANEQYLRSGPRGSNDGIVIISSDGTIIEPDNAKKH